MQRERSQEQPMVKISYKCEICKDREYVIEGNTAYPCKCQELRKYERILESSGISKAFKTKTFTNFNVKGKPQEIIIAKNTAMDFVRNYEQIKDKGNNSIAFLGQVGAGKTHLSIAIANNLMKKLVPVLYMPYRDSMTQLKQLIVDQEGYQREINKYKRAKVLLIDDLYKGRITDSDINIMFEIINYRYLNGMTVIISSEKNVDAILEQDQAIGSRIIEMSKGRIIEFQGTELNHRLI